MILQEPIMIKIKNICAIIFLFLTLFSNSIYSSDKKQVENTEPLDQIVAIVNDDVITTSELHHGLKMVKLQIAQEHIPSPSQEVLRKQVLNQLINKKLQLQIAKLAGIKITDQDLNQIIERVATQNQISTAALYDRLQQEGMSVTEYKKEMREQMTLQKLQQQEVISKITVSPEEVSALMQSNSGQHDSKEYHLQDILIPFSETPSTNEISAAKNRANQLLAQLKSSQTKSLSKLSHVEKNDLGFRTSAEMPSAFYPQVRNLKTGEFAGPIQTANGFHILHLLATRTRVTTETPPDKKQIEAKIMQSKFEEAVQQWLSKLRSQAFIEIKQTV